MRLAPVLAVLMMGLALYVSRGVLDQILTPAGLVRVALLPPVQALAAFIGLGALGLLWLDRRTVPRGTATAVRPALGALLRPAFGLLVLLLPYSPVLPDVFPALQMLAGPARGVVWLVVVTQLLWVFWQVRLLRADWLQRWTLHRAAVAIGLSTTILCGVGAARLTGTVLFPAGDEPHYLIIAQSLLRDRDLKIENNHTRRDYAEYFAPTLEPHYLTRGADGEIYSIHPVGMPILIAPAYALGGYRAVVVLFTILAGVAAALMWHTIVRALNALGAATFASAAVIASVPFLFNSFAIYPEIPAALAVVAATTLIVGGAGPRSPLTRWPIVGLACAALPWLSTKYAPMSAALVSIAVARILWPTPDHLPPPIAWRPPPAASAARSASSPGRGDRGEGAAAAGVLVPYAVSLAAWFWFFHAIWGSPWPQAPYGDLVQTSPFNLVFGAPGLLFDQEYGVLAYAPVYVLAFTGLWIMWRSGGELRRRSVEIALVVASLFATVGAFRIWWGGTAPPGRPLTSILLLLAFPIAVAFRHAPMGSARRAAQHLLLWVSLGISALVLLAREGFLLLNDRDGTSALLGHLSPHWPAWTIAPSFTFHEAPTAMLHTVAWLALAAGAAAVIARSPASHPGPASLRALTAAAVALAAGLVIVPLLPADPPWPGIDLRTRSRSPLLDEFDATGRPVGIQYTPFSFVTASEVRARTTLGVERDSGAPPQALRLLHNGRFSVPAGRYRVEVDWGGARDGETIGLQVGRTGEPWRSYAVTPRPGERWSAEFEVPLDVGFIGLRGTPEIERAIDRITIVPLAVVDRAARPNLPPVLGASQSNESAIFSFDENIFPEASGFWIRGGRTTRAAIHRPAAAGPLVLKVHSGLIANRLRIVTGGWAKTFVLQREQPEEIEVPSDDRALVTLELSAEATFVPRDVSPAATDPRPLGVWIEVRR